MKKDFFVLSTFGLAGLVFSFLLFTTCKPKSTVYEPTYSVDSSQKKTLLYGVPSQGFFDLNIPFVNYLNERLDSFRLQAVAAINTQAHFKNLNARLFDLTYANGIFALDSTRMGYSILAVSVEEKVYAGVILVNKDSSINTVSDLKGRSIASVGFPAFVGHMLQMMYLFKKGLNVNKEINLKYVESFPTVILSIYLGKCSAGFISLTGWLQFIKNRPEVASKVELKWMTDPAEANPILIRSDVDKNAVIKLKELVLNMHLNDEGRNALAVLGYRKFVPADSNTYKPLRNFLKEYRELIVDPKK